MDIIAEYFEGKKPFKMRHPYEGTIAEFRIIELEQDLGAAIVSGENAVTHDGKERVEWQWPISLERLLDVLKNQG